MLACLLRSRRWSASFRSITCSHSVAESRSPSPGRQARTRALRDHSATATATSRSRQRIERRHRDVIEVDSYGLRTGFVRRHLVLRRNVKEVLRESDGAFLDKHPESVDTTGIVSPIRTAAIFRGVKGRAISGNRIGA